jgi:hypothetical protein
VDGADPPVDDVEHLDGEGPEPASGHLGPVGGDRRCAVRPDRDEALLGEGVGRDEPAPDVGRSAHPERERRHLEDRVVAQQGDQRVHVVAGERVQ